MQIYWGAVPFVIIQVVMVGLIIAFPGIVSRDSREEVDLDKVKIEMPQESFGTPAAPPALPGASGAEPEAATPAMPSASSIDEEQKKIDDLFKK